MIKAAQEIIKKEKPKKYRIIFNGGSFLEVNHLHLHVLGGNIFK
jgi:diadenosine tetraphosphate (Ap4A) HIT family hydrolase